MSLWGRGCTPFFCRTSQDDVILLSGGGSVSTQLPLSYADYAAFLPVMRGVFLSLSCQDWQQHREIMFSGSPLCPSVWVASGCGSIACVLLPSAMTGRPAYVGECESPCWFVLRPRQLHMELHISASSFLALSRPQWPMETTWYVRFLASVCINLITMA